MTEPPKPPEAGDRLVAAANRPSPPEQPTRNISPRPHRPALPQPVTGPVRVWRGVVAFLAAAVRLASRLAALILVLYAIFTVFRANPANIWYQFVESLASPLSVGLANLFQLADVRWTTLVNYGLAALVWLIVGSVVAGLIRRAAP
ncbi:MULTISPECIES: hypothetical protein [unclassified Nonomuraea]|uniref:hypothetical protein n=1 Tax=unclassified Nonomuraea TaxID=2593643 RepID=UPI0033F25036